MRFLLLHPPTYQPASIAAALESEEVVVQVVNGPYGLRPASHPTVFVLDAASRDRFPADALVRFVDEGGSIVALGEEGEADVPEELPVKSLNTFVPQPSGPRQILLALRSAVREAAGRTEAAGLTREVARLTQIGIALSTERDLRKLLKTILTHAQRLTQSDAGSLYLVERTDGEPTHLRFALAQGESRPEAPFVETRMAIDVASMAGFVTIRGEPLVVDDAYEIPDDVEYGHNRFFDENYNYRTKSMLTVPMRDHKDQIIGVLQLINRKRTAKTILRKLEDFEREVIPYTPRAVELISSLAAQAAVAIENSRLYADIERLFEGFVRASVTAIEQRDPTTSGHSFRVADLTVRLAEEADREEAGPLKDVSFSSEQIREIRYASLLHDFGKVGVREQVLVKAKKLYPASMELVRRRCAFVRRTVERDLHMKRAQFLEAHGQDGYDAYLAELKAEYDRRMAELERFLGAVERANEPTVLPEDKLADLELFAGKEYEDLGGERRVMLTADEFQFLSIKRGSLDATERQEIESHVTHTFRFLEQIPWTNELRSVPDIAYGHHEKIDGTGYPRRLREDEIPVQAKMMSIADIFDALTAQDRPYKAAMPTERALDIIGSEVRSGKLDQELFRLFVDADVYKVTAKPKPESDED